MDIWNIQENTFCDFLVINTYSTTRNTNSNNVITVTTGIYRVIYGANCLISDI